MAIRAPRGFWIGQILHAIRKSDTSVRMLSGGAVSDAAVRR